MRVTGVVLAAVLLALCGCQKKEAAHTINDSMTKIMEPNAETIWDTMSKAYNDKGDALDAAKLSDADWQKMADASAKLRDRAQEMIDNAKDTTVAAANEPILGSQAVGKVGPAGKDWDAVSADTIKKRIDAKPDLFAEKAKVLLDAANGMNRASTSKDAVLLHKVASGLDEVCDGCHEPFWGTDEPPPFPKTFK